MASLGKLIQRLVSLFALAAIATKFWQNASGWQIFLFILILLIAHRTGGILKRKAEERKAYEEWKAQTGKDEERVSYEHEVWQGEEEDGRER